MPPGSNWSPLGSKGYKYKDQTAAQDGITKIILKGGDAGKSKALVKGKGLNLPDFDSDLPIDEPAAGGAAPQQLERHLLGRVVRDPEEEPDGSVQREAALSLVTSVTRNVGTARRPRRRTGRGGHHGHASVGERA